MIINFSRESDGLSSKFQLTSLTDIYPNLKKREAKRLLYNFSRVFLAGSISAAGSLLSGLHPDVLGKIAGIFLSGLGNGLSTMFAWENKRSELIEIRMLKDFPKLVRQTCLINEKLAQLIEQIQPHYHKQIGATHQENLTSNDLFITKELEKANSSRWMLNTARISVAGGMSCAGGLIGGILNTQIAGVILGSVLSGMGNGLSTWLAFEQLNDRITRKTALEYLQTLKDLNQKNEKDLDNLIERTKMLYPNTLIALDTIEPTQPILEKKLDHAMTTPTSSNRLWDLLMGSRRKRNFVYVNAAGWLSGAGASISAFKSDLIGVCFGSLLGGAANGLSTWLAWENLNDKEVERIVLQDFPQVIEKTCKLSKEILRLSECIENQLAVLTKDSKGNSTIEPILESHVNSIPPSSQSTHS